MDEQGSPKFKIDFSDEPPEPPERRPASARPKKTEKQTARGPGAGIMSLLLFCVLGGLLFFGYYQLNNRLQRLEKNQTRSTDYVETRISEEVNKSFSALSELVTEPTQKVKARILETEKQLEKQTTATARLEKEFKELRQEVQTSQSELENRISKGLSETDAEIKTLSSGLNTELDELKRTLAGHQKTLDQAARMTDRVNEINKQMQDIERRVQGFGQTLNTLQSDMDSLQAAVQKAAPAQNIEKQITGLENTVKQRIQSSEGRLQKQIRVMEDQIQAMEAMIRSLQHMKDDAQNRNAGTGPSSSDSTRIIEQEIQ